jgi:hypothetical protein
MGLTGTAADLLDGFAGMLWAQKSFSKVCMQGTTVLPCGATA